MAGQTPRYLASMEFFSNLLTPEPETSGFALGLQGFARFSFLGGRELRRRAFSTLTRPADRATVRLSRTHALMGSAGARLSCPHAAMMSWPREMRMKAGTPRAVSTCWKARTRSSGGGR